ncbi:cation:proton antiporter [Streptomyces sp. HB132]|uniref:cation:proton antiporter n=1 Tax=Streptomyces sp. HB132 TaxID=767388 RepID=UPI001960F326|nr:cation:proton antiporter [Streptomyces sp. HB132]MBM7442266.1 Kef-type K+ transport system membrane component KefB [Streptomyces sp. HB132]
MTLPVAAHAIAALGSFLVVGLLGRRLARRIGQPGVVGEIAFGMLLGPAVLGWAWPGAQAVLLPADVLEPLRDLGHAGLVLFLVGVAHELRLDASRLRDRAIGWTTLGTLVPSLMAGAAFGGWLVLHDRPSLRGTAPTLAFVLLLAITMAVSAVPVLARILADRGLTATHAGRLSLTSAALVDAVAWLLLAVVIAVARPGSGGISTAAVVLVAGVPVAVLGRRLLKTSRAERLCARWTWPVAVVLGFCALRAADVAESLGLTAIFGAFMVGLMIPPGSPHWDAPVRRVSTLGLWLVPVFFVATGLSVWTGSGGIPWLVTILATIVAVLSKIGGGYAVSRLGGEGHTEALRIGVMLNTRGLTEIVLLQAGYSAGVLTSGLYLALLVMAVATTSLTGPLLSLIDRRHGAAAPPPRKGEQVVAG